VGWYWRFGAPATAAALRTWTRDGQVLAVGLLDGARLPRLTTAPDIRQDKELARRLVADLTTPEHGILPHGEVNVEAPPDALVNDLLADEGRVADEPFVPLLRDLAGPVEDTGVHVEGLGPGRPGLIEPLGVHPDHRGHGYGRATTVAGAGTLRELGSSSALVITERSRAAAGRLHLVGRGYCQGLPPRRQWVVS
jgi:GNAT superfamily N-acetyltransferase